jgi:hypothetical protein
VPHKRTLAATAAAAGSGGWALVRWVSGQWLPSWHQLLANHFFGAYVLVSAIVGAAVTYLYDDRKNDKVNTLITVSSSVTLMSATLPPVQSAACVCRSGLAICNWQRQCGGRQQLWPTQC